MEESERIPNSLLGLWVTPTTILNNVSRLFEYSQNKEKLQSVD
jgi:hypothetical protein